MPKVFDLCEDASIIGTPFYVSRRAIPILQTDAHCQKQVMEFVKGRIITDVDLGELSPGDRRKT